MYKMQSISDVDLENAGQVFSLSDLQRPREVHYWRASSLLHPAQLTIYHQLAPPPTQYLHDGIELQVVSLNLISS